MTDLATTRDFGRYWKMTVTRGGCVMCHAFPVGDELLGLRKLQLAIVEGHHVVPKHFLADEGLINRKTKDDTVEQLRIRFDDRNGVGLCTYHHGRHTDWIQRMPRELVPAETYEFAEEYGLLNHLDREYPA